MKQKKTISIPEAVKAIEKYGILLVYPINNKKLPKSLWSVFYPDEEMHWKWDESGDDRVGQLWRLKSVLGVSRKVIYAKWYKGRATFFSKEIFTALVALVGSPLLAETRLSKEANQILEVLEMDSPQSTKQIKLATELRGKTFERIYERAMRELWGQFLIVGFGEVEDGAFPSLAVGATKTLFEDVVESAKKMSEADALETIQRILGDRAKLFEEFSKRRNDSTRSK